MHINNTCTLQIGTYMDCVVRELPTPPHPAPPPSPYLPTGLVCTILRARSSRGNRPGGASVYARCDEQVDGQEAPLGRDRGSGRTRRADAGGVVSQ